MKTVGKSGLLEGFQESFAILGEVRPLFEVERNDVTGAENPRRFNAHSEKELAPAV